MEDVGIFYGHLVYFVALWYIFPFGYLCCTKKKSGNPAPAPAAFQQTLSNM
jgi:hypothetical protein